MSFYAHIMTLRSNTSCQMKAVGGLTNTRPLAKVYKIQPTTLPSNTTYSIRTMTSCSLQQPEMTTKALTKCWAYSSLFTTCILQTQIVDLSRNYHIGNDVWIDSRRFWVNMLKFGRRILLVELQDHPDAKYNISFKNK
jgi:hypothetical protein